MTSKERMILAMLNRQPDRIPVAPDMSNMIPCRLTGRPFWEIYLYRNPPLWKANIDAVKYFGFDGWLPIFSDMEVIDENLYIVFEDETKIITRRMERENGREVWSPMVTVYPVNNPPTHLNADKVGIGERSKWYKPIERKIIQKNLLK